jgi:hypothetical protein
VGPAPLGIILVELVKVSLAVTLIGFVMLGVTALVTLAPEAALPIPCRVLRAGS